ncbi:hypothetical protein Godav_023384 [Gossypium davidsonii]|uniref:Uncharacterized protein n=1 Tax=Gossypium davidsonii TaxID=34287 RepID=A0A7J8SRH6_GOSDV|nr:hypothetical protein [Gossypium davidsonii]
MAKLAKRCLNLNGKKRPTMKQVTMELELIKASEEGNAIEGSGDEESQIDDIFESWDINPSCSMTRQQEGHGDRAMQKLLQQPQQFLFCLLCNLQLM